MTALQATSVTDSGHANTRPPRDGLVRLWSPGIEMRAPDASGTTSETLFGHFAVWNRWTEIDSFFEGNFMERLAPGCMNKTFKDQRDSIRVLFQHGRDQTLGMKPLGSIKTLRSDSDGAFYEVPLFRGIPDIIMDGLRENQYGASFKFRVIRESIRTDSKVSADNPKGLDERTIEELQLFEFGPVTFPAYAEATAGLRSLTDDFILDGMAHADPELVRMAANGVDFAGLIAHRVGLNATRPVTFNRVGGQVEESEQTVDKNASATPHEVYNSEGTLVASFADEDQARAYKESLSTVTRETEAEETSTEAETEGSTETTAVTETRDAAPDAGANGATEEASTDDKENAAPGQGSTPLIGPAGYRESWRL